MGGLPYKKFKEAVNEKQTQMKEADAEEKERQSELKDTLGDKIPKYPYPISQSYRTFDSWSKYYKVNKPNPRQKDAPGFGKAERFGMDEKAKFQKQIKLYNEGIGDGKELDPKADPVPGPGAYNLSEVWKGKKVKMRRPYSAQPKTGERILSSISKGPTISCYYRK